MVESGNHETVDLGVVAEGSGGSVGSGRGPGALFQEVDRRRRAVRDSADRLVAGAMWLLPSDRALVIAVYRDGVRPADAAAVAGVGVRGVRRRLRRLCTRILSERFWFVVRARDGWPAARRRAATLCVLQGFSKRHAARFLQVSVHHVRQEMSVVEALFATRCSSGEGRAA